MRALRVQGAGVTLAVQEHGERQRPTVLLVHGFPDTHGLWSDVVAGLADRYHVVTYDLRGAGASDLPAGRREYRLGQLACDARAVMDACAPGERVHLVGHDWGAIQGWEFLYAEETAPQIASFTSISGACFDHVGLLLRARLRRPTPSQLAWSLGQLRRSWYMALCQAPGAFGLVWQRVLAARWGSMLRRLEGIEPGPDFPAPTIVSDGVNLAGLYWRTPLLRLLRPVRRTPVSVPVLVVRPIGDRFLHPHTLDNAGEFVPDLTRRTVPGGHWAPRSYPGLVAELVSEHVDRVTGGRAGQPTTASSAA
jgi:pimeloyl-ACP methyl ester carboxylesterase